ncbi:hypothetical protein [Thermoactinomyces mirandus]|uniref:CRISPR-associated protein Cas6 C-terminal domain-containing protein n=1 Tax=Thermoactinomyces mirandus TaxID=2756294 RepID=A0A7W2AR06_9BACL|nr:hypothetical protein [Thermoactinomyces mirandus]MBA4602063.1 hypothetical protein [Thermoactinomyces mirandus]
MRAAKWALEFMLPEGGRLPANKSSMFYAILKKSFKRMVCIQRYAVCGACSFAAECAYSQLFGVLHREAKEDSPSTHRTYGINPGQDFDNQIGIIISGWEDMRKNYKPGEFFRIEIVLVDQMIELFPLVALSFKEWQSSGLGKEKIPFLLHRIWIYPAENEESTRLLMFQEKLMPIDVSSMVVSVDMLRENKSIQKDGSLSVLLRGWLLDPSVISAVSVRFSDVMKEVANRFWSLNRYFDMKERQKLESCLNDAMDAADKVQIVSGTFRIKKQRMNVRRESKLLQWDGLLRIQGEGLPTVYPWVKMAEWFHIGYQAHLGMGRLRVLPGECKR